MPIPPPLLGGAGMKDHGRRPDFSIRVTVAGQRRIRTGFPYYALGTSPGAPWSIKYQFRLSIIRFLFVSKKASNPPPAIAPNQR